jgi:hypothetical protein
MRQAEKIKQSYAGTSDRVAPIGIRWTVDGRTAAPSSFVLSSLGLFAGAIHVCLRPQGLLLTAGSSRFFVLIWDRLAVGAVSCGQAFFRAIAATFALLTHRCPGGGARCCPGMPLVLLRKGWRHAA